MQEKFKRKPLLSELSLREKIGQTAVMQMSLFMNKENLDEYLKDNPIGNVWHNGNYAMTTTNLTCIEGGELHDSEFYRKWALSLRDMLRVPPFIGLDPPDSGFATNLFNIVNASTVGAANSAEYSYSYGKILALVSKSVGANYSWSTCVDIPSRFSSVNIMRAMSDKLDKLTELSLPMVKGLQDNGVAATIKHFPGNDQTEYRDPHFSPVCVNSTLDEWMELQGAAFQAMIDGGAHSVMVGHQGFPAVDSREFGNSYRPATISYNIITKLLKEKMQFEGVVITDAIDMAGLSAVYPNVEDLYVELLNAGNDLLLNVKSYDYVDMVEKAVKDGRISEERINDACSRVLDIKEKIGLFQPLESIIMDEKLKMEISDICSKISEKAITLECDLDRKLPIDATKIHNVTIVCSTHSDKSFDALSYMKNAFEKRGMNVNLQRRITSAEEMSRIDEESDLIIYAGYLAPHAPMGASSFYGEECETFFFAFTKGAEKSIGVSLQSVYVYYDFYTNLKTFAHIYSLSRESQEAFVKAIFGEIPFSGTMPYIKPGGRKE